MLKVYCFNAVILNSEVTAVCMCYSPIADI